MMNQAQKLIVSALFAVLATTIQPISPVLGEGVKETTDQKPAPAKAAATETVKQSDNDPIAKVGNTIITRAELNKANAVFMTQNPPGQELTPDQAKQVEEYPTEQLVAAELLYQAGLKIEIKDLEKMIDAKIADGKAKFPNPADFEKALKAQNLDEKQLREYSRKEIIINNLIEKEIVTKVTISDDEIKKFYDDNREKYFNKPEQVRASHILIGADAKTDAEAKKKARGKAEALLKEIKGGKDFAELAKSNSTCPSSAQGGDLGLFGKGQMVPAFENAAFALKPGDVSEVVETQFGYHIIKLTEKKAGENISLTDSKTKISDFLKNQKVNSKVSEYINDLRVKTKIEKMLK